MTVINGELQHPPNFSEILSILKTLSFQAMGFSSPNPPVACVITDLNCNILATGSTQKAGENHAEREAYRHFAEKFPNSKTIPHLVFVTLEPCTHFGRTAPCLDLLLEYKPIGVYYGLSDPNPLVKQRDGLRELRDKGIKVMQDSEIKEVGRAFLSGFISRIETGRPQIFMKSALSKEGFYSDSAKSKISLSNIHSNQITQMLRAKLDAIIVGPTTVFVDYPGLDFRGFDLDLPGLENSKPSYEKATPESAMIFTQTLFESISNHNFLKSHISQLIDYQPFRVFVLSLRRIPDQAFLQKQKLLNDKFGNKKVIFFLLDFDVENSSHQNLLIKIGEVSFDSPVIVSDKNELVPKIVSKFSELSLNTVLVEGGNLLYKLFSQILNADDLIYLIRTEKSIKEGIFPEINLKERKKLFEKYINTDLWEVYGE